MKTWQPSEIEDDEEYNNIICDNLKNYYPCNEKIDEYFHIIIIIIIIYIIYKLLGGFFYVERLGVVEGEEGFFILCLRNSIITGSIERKIMTRITAVRFSLMNWMLPK